MRTLLLATALTVTLTACDSQPPKTLDEVNQIIRLADEAIGAMEKIGTGAPAADVRAAMEGVNTALSAAQMQIEAISSRVFNAKYQGRGSIDPHDISVCMQARLALAVSIEGPMMMRALWQNGVLDCASHAKVYLSGASGDDAGAVALAASVLEPIAAVGIAYGMAFDDEAQTQSMIESVPENYPSSVIESVLDNYRSANEAIVAKLKPRCSGRKDAETEPVAFKCAAYVVALSVQPKLQALAAKFSKSP